MQVIAAFAERGILDVIPRKDVFTFNAWKDLGRSVKKGEHGVKIPVWIERKKSDDSEESVRFCKMTTVFHVSQTKEN
jgi:antirestriction protein ArdC